MLKGSMKQKNRTVFTEACDICKWKNMYKKGKKGRVAKLCAPHILGIRIYNKAKKTARWLHYFRIPFEISLRNN